MTAEKAPGQVSWTARNMALAGPGDQPGDVLAELDGTWDYLDPEQREAEETGAQAAIDAFLAGDSVSAGSIREALAAHSAPGRIGQAEDQLAESERTIADYRDALTAMQAERDDLKGLIAEMLEAWEAVDARGPATRVQLAKWHKRAGLTS